MRRPRYRVRFGPRCELVRPRLLATRAVLGELVLFAMFFNLRNDPWPQTRSRRQHPVSGQGSRRHPVRVP
jgi:hypothetical protein